MRGQEPVFVVVDDPDGHVAPTPGVLIVNGKHIGNAARILIGNSDGTFNRIADADMSLAFNSHEAWRRANLKRELERSPFIADTDRNSRRMARKSKQRLKGLRS